MKKIFTILSAVALAFGLASCSKEPVLSLEDKTVSVSAEGAEETVTFQTNQAWKVESDADWCVATPSEGAAADGVDQTVTIKVAKNETIEARSAKVTVTAGTLVSVITVNQSRGEAYITLTSEPKVGLDITASTVAVNFSTNAGWKATCDASWCTLNPNAGPAGNKIMNVAVAANPAATSRKATVTITADDKTATVVIRQSGTNESFDDIPVFNW